MKNDKQIVYESLLSRIRELELEVQNNKGMIVETAGKFIDSKELFAKFIKFQNAESNDLAIFLDFEDFIDEQLERNPEDAADILEVATYVCEDSQDIFDSDIHDGENIIQIMSNKFLDAERMACINADR